MVSLHNIRLFIFIFKERNSEAPPAGNNWFVRSGSVVERVSVCYVRGSVVCFHSDWFSDSIEDEWGVERK
jgi:hypothetical protein